MTDNQPESMQQINTAMNPIPPVPVQRAKSKKIFSVVVILILLCAAGAGMYAYYSGMFISLPSLASQAIDKARTTTSGVYDVTASIDFSEIKDTVDVIPLPFSSNKFSITAKGAYDSSDPGNLKSSTVISLNVGSSFEVEIRVSDDMVYGSMAKIPTELELFLPSLSLYENKWISFSSKSDVGKLTDNPLVSVFPIDSIITDKLTEEQKTHIYELSSKASFIKTVERFSPETVEGELSYHFIFDLDRSGITSYLQSLKEYVNTIGKDNSALSAFDPTTFDKSLDNLRDFWGEIWIGRNDKFIHKIILNFGIQPNPTKAEKIRLTVVGIMSGWNEPVSIVAPVEYVTFEKFIADVMSNSIFGGITKEMDVAREKGEKAKIKNYLSSLRVEAELFFDSQYSYLDFCSSPKLDTYRENIENTGGSGFVCKDSLNAYAIGVKFPDNSGYWCIDSTGTNKATATLPTSIVCPIK